MICENIGVNGKGHLTFAGQDTVELAAKYSTPLYLMDEDRIRHNCRVYKQAMTSHFGEGSFPIYASKAACFKRMYVIMQEEGLGVDVVSVGEIYTAYCAGFDMEKVYFHSNNKTEYDIAFAMEHGVGCFVADNLEELQGIQEEAAKRGITQRVLLRLTPGIDTHTYEAVNTGKVDSKFGVAIETGQAEELLRFALELKNVKLEGFHCHIGSQVFDADTFLRGSDIMMEFMAMAAEKYGFITEVLDLGGGYGVRYTEGDPVFDMGESIGEVARRVKENGERLGIKLPKVIMEPGRSIVADAGMTLYTAGAIKRIPGYKNYVSVDGGMTDNPRYALYGSEYTLFAANRMNEENKITADVVGRCCESGDIIQPQVTLPEIRRGDIIAVCTTGAYNYSMASRYNRIPVPPVVMLRDGGSYVAVKGETLEDIIRNDI